MNDMDIAEQAIAEGKIDAVAFARAQLADPEIPNKTLSNQPEKIRPCIGCNMGCLNRLFEGKNVCCAVNPTAMRETEYALKPIERKKNVIIVGGGVGGMEAARVAALRGHNVQIIEKSDRLGGHLNDAGAHAFKKDVEVLNKWYQGEINDLHIPVTTNREITVDELKDSDADTIILATGSVPVMPISIPGIDMPHVYSSLDGVHKAESFGDNVVIVGGGLVGCEIALDCAKRGKKVTIVEAREDIMSAGAAVPVPNKQMLLESFEKYGVAIKTSQKLKEIRRDSVIIESSTGETELAADSVVIAIGFRPVDIGVDELTDSSKEIFKIGDAKQARSIMSAIWEGYETANSI